VSAVLQGLILVNLLEILPGSLTITQYIHIGEVSSSFCAKRLLL